VKIFHDVTSFFRQLVIYLGPHFPNTLAHSSQPDDEWTLPLWVTQYAVPEV
jgi:hypothetical protein